MNKHFEDARYYLSRAVQNAKRGVKTELEPVERRFREMTGREEEPEPSRIDTVREELGEIQEKAQGETKEAIGNARRRLKEYREG